jgi:hypothetical protein
VAWRIIVGLLSKAFIGTSKQLAVGI